MFKSLSSSRSPIVVFNLARFSHPTPGRMLSALNVLSNMRIRCVHLGIGCGIVWSSTWEDERWVRSDSPWHQILVTVVLGGLGAPFFA